MAQQSRTQLKTYFETNDIPSQEEFGHEIDSGFNLLDDTFDEVRDGAEYKKIKVSNTYTTEAQKNVATGLNVGSLIFVEETGKIYVVSGTGAGSDAVDANQSAATGVTTKVSVVTGVTNGQTSFTIPEEPAEAGFVMLAINDIPYFKPAISVSGTTVTWGNSFPIADTDEVKIRYTTL